MRIPERGGPRMPPICFGCSLPIGADEGFVSTPVGRGRAVLHHECWRVGGYDADAETETAPPTCPYCGEVGQRGRCECRL